MSTLAAQLISILQAVSTTLWPYALQDLVVNFKSSGATAEETTAETQGGSAVGTLSLRGLAIEDELSFRKHLHVHVHGSVYKANVGRCPLPIFPVTSTDGS